MAILAVVGALSKDNVGVVALCRGGCVCYSQPRGACSSPTSFWSQDPLDVQEKATLCTTCSALRWRERHTASASVVVLAACHVACGSKTRVGECSFYLVSKIPSINSLVALAACTGSSGDSEVNSSSGCSSGAPTLSGGRCFFDSNDTFKRLGGLLGQGSCAPWFVQRGVNLPSAGFGFSPSSEVASSSGVLHSQIRASRSTAHAFYVEVLSCSTSALSMVSA